MAHMNMLTYANFRYNDYEPSEFRDYLVDTATATYNDYAEGRIIELKDGVQVETQPMTVKEYFDEQISQMAKGMNGKIFNDVNYETIIDDIMLYVDENNVALKEALKQPKVVN